MSEPLLDVARRIVLSTIAYLDEVQACPFCELGHVPEEVEMFSKHDAECPLRGFEKIEDVERLRAWATPRHGTDQAASGGGGTDSSRSSDSSGTGSGRT